MPTDRQRAANRANARLSTGPRTTRGRAAVRCNSLLHGFYARVAIPDFEDPAEYHAVLDDYLADLRPAGAVETELVHRLVKDIWKLRRLEHLERSFLIASIDRAELDVDAATSTSTERAAYAFEHWVETQFGQFKSEAPIERLSRLQFRLRRSADATFRLLHDLQSERLAAPGAASAPFAEIASAGPDTLVYFSTPPPAGAPDPTVAVLSSSARLPAPPPTPPSSVNPESTPSTPPPAASPSSVNPDAPPSARPTPPNSPPTPSTSPTIHKLNPEIGFAPPKTKSKPPHLTPKRPAQRPHRRSK